MTIPPDAPHLVHSIAGPAMAALLVGVNALLGGCALTNAHPAENRTGGVRLELDMVSATRQMVYLKVDESGRLEYLAGREAMIGSEPIMVRLNDEQIADLLALMRAAGWLSTGWTEPEGDAALPEYRVKVNVPGTGASTVRFHTEIGAAPRIVDMMTRAATAMKHAELFESLDRSALDADQPDAGADENNDQR